MRTTIYSLIIIGVWALTAVWQVRFAERKTFFDDALDIKNAAPVRGLCALTIVLHHFTASVDEPHFLILFSHIGHLIVAMFFFFSGYGLMCGLQRNANYISPGPFLKKRIVKIMIPYWLCVILCTLMRLTIFPPVTWKHVPWAFIMPNQVVRHSWYVFAALALYVSFMLIFRIKDQKKALRVMGVWVAVLTAVLIALKLSIWARSLPAFYIGVLFGAHKEKIFAFLQKKYWMKLLGTAAPFAVFSGLQFWFVLHENERLQTCAATCASTVFVVLAVQVMMKARLGNPILRFADVISYELYLIHGIFCANFYYTIHNTLLFCLAVFACSIASAFLLHLLLKKIDKALL